MNQNEDIKCSRNGAYHPQGVNPPAPPSHRRIAYLNVERNEGDQAVVFNHAHKFLVQTTVVLEERIGRQVIY